MRSAFRVGWRARASARSVPGTTGGAPGIGVERGVVAPVETTLGAPYPMRRRSHTPHVAPRFASGWRRERPHLVDTSAATGVSTSGRNISVPPSLHKVGVLAILARRRRHRRTLTLGG